MKHMRSKEDYAHCEACGHTTNIHNKNGCRAYKCSCKKGHP